MAHNPVPAEAVTSRRLLLSAAMTILFVAVEGASGYFANSLALLSDAGHNLSDALALLFSWFALWLSRRPADARRTYGYHRAGILAALVNSLSLVLIAFWIVVEAVKRLCEPEPVQTTTMIGVALAAVLLNGAIGLWLHGGARHDLNVRSAYLHMLGDALSALGVVVAGAIAGLTGQAASDPVVSLLIAALILWSSWGILSEAVNILLEAAPKYLDMAAMERAVRETPGVQGMHDLHVWAIASGIIACSCHLVVAEQSVRQGQQILRAVAVLMREKFGITHSTIQVEVEKCEPNAMCCILRNSSSEYTEHDHGREESTQSAIH